MSILACLSAFRLALHAAMILALDSEPDEKPGALVETAKSLEALHSPSSSSDLPPL